MTFKTRPASSIALECRVSIRTLEAIAEETGEYVYQSSEGPCFEVGAAERLRNYIRANSRDEMMQATITETGNLNHEESKLAAAICQTGRLPAIDRHFHPETLHAAERQFSCGVGLKDAFLYAAAKNGVRTNFSTHVDIDTQRAAFGLQASFSSLNLSSVLSNVANKFLKAGFDAVDSTWSRLAAIRPVSDFKEITTVSLVGDFTYEKVGAAGEIKHGTIGEEVYGNKADTYARMVSITRTDIINDDLGALTAAPRKLGRGAALKLNDIFWTEFLNNATFFAAGNNNVSTGALDVASLAAAEAVFENQTDPDGELLGASPAILLVPTALKSAGFTLMNSQELKGSTDGGSTNPYHGRFQLESSPYMSQAKFTGNSAAAWYLLADPMDLPVIEVAALGGRVEPVIESAVADFNVLGVQMRGYSDVGVRKQEFRGGVRSTGA
tara:strand:- start:230 stop:1549 length:1320 start_codon:yes stop_codon:yes gene_type:complete